MHAHSDPLMPARPKPAACILTRWTTSSARRRRRQAHRMHPQQTDHQMDHELAPPTLEPLAPGAPHRCPLGLAPAAASAPLACSRGAEPGGEEPNGELHSAELPGASAELPGARAKL